MEKESLVVCVEGHPGLLEEGQVYTVCSLEEHVKTKNIGVWLYEVDPPYPHRGFSIHRFVEIQKPMDVTTLVEDILQKTEC